MVSLTAGKNEDGRRLDRVVRKLFPRLPLSSAYRLIRTGKVTVNGNKQAKDYRIAEHDIIQVEDFLMQYVRRESNVSAGELDERNILFEDDDLLIINKERGSLVHGRKSLTIDVLGYLTGGQNSFSSFRPGPLHRLDRNTSGIICFGKTLKGAREFTELLSSQKLEKYYLAVIDGIVEEGQHWIDFLVRDRRRKKTVPGQSGSGKKGEISVIPLTGSNNRTAAGVRLFSGFTHQIRCQCSIHGHPLTGDRKYHGSPFSQGYILHAFCLRFPERTIVAPLSPSQEKRLKNLLPGISPETIISIFREAIG